MVVLSMSKKYRVDMQEYMQQKLYDMIDDAPNKYYRLPEQYDIHEYGIMKDFIDSLVNVKQKNKLFHAINGRGTFRRFKDKIVKLDIRDEWYAYQHNAYVDIAKHWAINSDLEYSAGDD